MSTYAILTSIYRPWTVLETQVRFRWEPFVYVEFISQIFNVYEIFTDYAAVT